MPYITQPRVIIAYGDVAVASSDYIVAMRQTVAASVYLPPNPPDGTNIVVKDVVGTAQNHNLRITTTDGSLIDGEPHVVITNNYGSLSLLFVSGSGWAIL